MLNPQLSSHAYGVQTSSPKGCAGISPGLSEAGFAPQNPNADLLAVGAVYDRTVVAVEWDERAVIDVIDRAYSGKVDSELSVVQSQRSDTRGHRDPLHRRTLKACEEFLSNTPSRLQTVRNPRCLQR